MGVFYRSEYDVMWRVAQVQALNSSLCDSAAMNANLTQRVTDMQRSVANSEQDRRVLQERFDNTRSVHIVRRPGATSSTIRGGLGSGLG